MKCLDSNRISKPTIENDIKIGHNLFVRSNEEIELRVNALGKKSNPQYVCIEPRAGKDGCGRNLVKIKCIKSKVKKLVLEVGLLAGHNPFNKSKNRVEVNLIQPMYERLFKKYKIDYIKEFRLGKKRIDFMFILNGKRYGLELKQSENRNCFKNQIQTYRRLANLSQYKIDKIILSDPKGKFSNKGSLSLSQFEHFISK